MPRDGSKARARLRAAALDLYRERGYDETTTAQIAARAEVSERTYFRHFADKREVLFDGEAELRAILVDAVAAAPDGLPPLHVMVRAFSAAVPLIVANRRVAEQRAEVIAVTPALQERAYAKTAGLTDVLEEALAARGTARPTARLAAQVGMAAFERASRAWAGDPDVDLSALIAQAADEVLTLGGT
ncbi:TetR/AcrR family transcriptional regulator [Streptacidiphilus fuscans]|uniref:TetR family transcriptional regulator n=1 Tax=Streptacidiphilus fuscans TaxID=2789292 RepID=A0A931F9K3_9ACTN|nr:TetR family transcriptional regulator [Streptacidiphilus fuscans]MBF9066722.1 TetR family transcriptional regulator [Streptacidiphilus fuscans]